MLILDGNSEIALHVKSESRKLETIIQIIPVLLYRCATCSELPYKCYDIAGLGAKFIYPVLYLAFYVNDKM